MCQNPINIANPMKYRERLARNKPNRIDVPCSSCSQCLKRRCLDWTFRLKQENKRSSSCHFVTLTYEDRTIPIAESNGEYYYSLHKPDLQKFLKRLRKLQLKTSNEKLKYYAVGEYGSLYQRPHYHLILFNLDDPNNVSKAWSYYGDPIGITETEPLKHDGGLMYVVNYFINNKKTDHREPEFSTMSKNLGDNFITPQIIKWYRQDYSRAYVVHDGYKQPMPRYYKNKIWQSMYEQELVSAAIDVRVNELYDKKIKQLLDYGYKSESFIDENGIFQPSADVVSHLRQINAKYIKNTKKVKI